MQAHKTSTGKTKLGRAPPNTETLLLPCGDCLGCKTAKAKEWALRCHLELQLHDDGAFSTLTYEDRWLPPSLDKRHLQLWLKRFRARLPNRTIRFFASGEYGEQNNRPHYHALLFGVSEKDQALIEETWRVGYVKTMGITPAAIAYVAGYTSKKLGDRQEAQGERVDPETGEVYTWQPPFVQMSRRPGIGGHARKHHNSWRSYALLNGIKMPVPRFYHEAWKQQASPEQLLTLEAEKKQRQQQQNLTLQMLEAYEKINEAKQALRASKRRL